MATTFTESAPVFKGRSPVGGATAASDGTVRSVKVKVFRFDPSREARPRYESYEVPYEKDMRVLDALDYLADHIGVGIGYRWFCGVKKCGLCGVCVNGKPLLACWEPALPEMVIEPMPNFPVIRDLVVDRTHFESMTLRMNPVLIRKEPYKGPFPEPLTHKQMIDPYKLISCIECYVCTASCPVFEDAGHQSFAGPASLVQLARVALNPLDGADRVSLALKADVYACVSCYNCSHVCPVGIDVVGDAIERLKQMCAASSIGSHGATHSTVFTDIVRKYGRIHPATLLLRTLGLRGAIARMAMGLKLFFRGKVKVMARTIPGIEQIRRIFDQRKR